MAATVPRRSGRTHARTPPPIPFHVRPLMEPSRLGTVFLDGWVLRIVCPLLQLPDLRYVCRRIKILLIPWQVDFASVQARIKTQVMDYCAILVPGWTIHLLLWMDRWGIKSGRYFRWCATAHAVYLRMPEATRFDVCCINSIGRMTIDSIHFIVTPVKH